ncbi:uncharacterized protein EV422DRAFT_492153 [Fimicolochytrium jonesii]|uniref:uncharacterized protein n=1 Tax=Fimicolochytrium jonesii TaxID=1396493 RepID=UPI0022FDB954|nr:uncharacterized protein EV422DRAFT_492153 [Fimicolochytrium jonesii]KAI8825953.1 hypothetical protein EV422DRAFT_492153 [Fimicolochytrium jonesii]
MDFSHLDALFVDPEAYLQSSALSFEGSTLPPVWKKDETALADDVFVPEYVFYSPATGVVRAKRFQDFAGDDGTWLRRQAEVGTFWIDVLNPTAEELFLISKVFSIHPLTIDDIANDDMQREKCDAYPDYLALTIRVIDTHNFDTSEELSPALLWILIYPHCILTFHMQPLSHVSKTIQRLAKLHNLTEKKLKLQVGTEFQTAWIGYLLIDEILSDLNPIIHHIKRESDELDEQLLDVWEDQVENFRDRNMLIRIHEARKQNVVILRLMVDKINVLKGVIKKGSRGVGRGKLLGNELELYFDSLLDRAQAVAQQLKTFEEALTRIHSEYLEEISLCLNAASKTAGDLTRKMTAVVTLLIPVGAITGMMGYVACKARLYLRIFRVNRPFVHSINVTVPGHHRDDGDGDTTAFWFATVFMLSLIVSGYHFARKWHWFSDPT